MNPDDMDHEFAVGTVKFIGVSIVVLVLFGVVVKILASGIVMIVDAIKG